MKEYIERFLTALENIARALQSRPLVAPAAVAPAATTTDAPAAANDDLLAMPGSEAPVKTRKPRAAAAPAAPAAPAAAAAPVAEATAITMPQVAEVVRKLIQQDAAGGHVKAKSVLAEFGAQRISELKETQFPEVMAKINALLAALPKK